MMISQRPSAGTGSTVQNVGGGSSSMGGGAGVSIGNYKGVMLCNRPFAGVAAAAKGAHGGQGKKIPFRSAVVPPEPLGLNPTREIRPQAAGRRKKKNSALSRHKKWLHDLQKAKEKYQQDAEEQAQRQDQGRDEP